MRRRLNTKLFVCLLLALLVMAVGVHFLHAYQVRRGASGLLDQAAKAEEEERYADAAKFLNHYLGYVPEDTDALARYGFALDKLPPVPTMRLKALLVFDQVLRLEPERTDVRRRLVTLAMEMARYQEAVDHLGILLKGSPQDAELEEVLGRCYEAEKDLKNASIHYQKAKKIDPARISSYAVLARVSRQLDQTNKAANEVMDELVKNNPNSFRAFVMRALYRKELG